MRSGIEQLFPARFFRIPALALEGLGQRIDRAIVVLLVAFLVTAGFLGQVEPGTCGFIHRRDDGRADPQHQPVGRAGLVRRHQSGDLDGLGEVERGE